MDRENDVPRCHKGRENDIVHKVGFLHISASKNGDHGNHCIEYLDGTSVIAKRNHIQNFLRESAHQCNNTEGLEFPGQIGQESVP